MPNVLKTNGMSKIDALKIVDNEIVGAVERLQANTHNPNKKDLFFLVDKYNSCNKDSYSYSDVSACSDCRRYIYKFWLNVVSKWNETK